MQHLDIVGVDHKSLGNRSHLDCKARGIVEKARFVYKCLHLRMRDHLSKQSSTTKLARFNPKTQCLSEG